MISLDKCFTETFPGFLNTHNGGEDLIGFSDWSVLSLLYFYGYFLDLFHFIPQLYEFILESQVSPEPHLALLLSKPTWFRAFETTLYISAS